jgi:beta-phosphoglucomutase-like phosphatase (HAD superfamily)
MNVGYFYFRGVFLPEINNCMKNIYPNAFLFDLNGTMIGDLDFHASSWFYIVNIALGAGGVGKSKPDPEIFNRATDLLDVPPEERLVLEDTPSGSEAAMNARMQSDVSATTHEQKKFSYHGQVRAFADDYSDKHLKRQLSF